MNTDYIIIDPRPLEAFKDSTFSGFKKKEVFKKLFDCIENEKIEESCYWITECICSGYSDEIFEKCMLLNSNLIHINNPNLPEFLYRKYISFVNSFNHIDKKNKDQLIHLRNTQNVRNCLFDIVITILNSSKKKRLNKQIKLSDDDYQFSEIKNKLKATMQILPSSVIRFTDPDELKIILNEFLFHLKNINGGYDDACYWINWLIQWEKINKKKKIKYEIECRNINNINPKYCTNIIWIIWETIFIECKERNNNIQTQIQNLYQLFIYNYSPGKRNIRLPYLYHCIAYLTYPINFNIKIRENKDLFIQSQCNINIMFKNKKNNEVKNYISAKINPDKNNQNINNEICESKFNSLLEVDELKY